MTLPSRFIPVAQKFTEIYAKFFGGLGLRDKSHISLPNVMSVVALRQNTKDLLVLLNHCLFPSGNGTRSEWTSSPAFQKPRKEMMPSSWSLTDFQKLLTSFQFASP